MLRASEIEKYTTDQGDVDDAYMPVVFNVSMENMTAITVKRISLCSRIR